MEISITKGGYMPKLRKGELKLYQLMSPTELNNYVKKFPENTEYVLYFLERYKYNWVKKKWRKGKTI